MQSVWYKVCASCGVCVTHARCWLMRVVRVRRGRVLGVAQRALAAPSCLPRCASIHVEEQLSRFILLSSASAVPPRTVCDNQCHSRIRRPPHTCRRAPTHPDHDPSTALACKLLKRSPPGLPPKSFQVVWTTRGGPGVVRSSRAVADAYAAFIHGGGDSGELAKLAASATPMIPTAVSGRKRTAAEAMAPSRAGKPAATPEPEPVAEDDSKTDSDQDDEAAAADEGEGEEEAGEAGEDVDAAEKFPEEDAEYESEGSEEDEDGGQDEDEEEDEDVDEDERPAKRVKTATWSGCAIC
mmetsp:Transcript_40683/g.121330  ORF Transcript_40683/g.121330 Transcript_40683/m.121330 type:complete len:296 (+) Transcript_40683:523-1410(+)